MAKVKGTNIESDDLIRALSDETFAMELMSKNGWSKEDLLKHAQALTKELEAAMARVNIV